MSNIQGLLLRRTCRSSLAVDVATASILILPAHIGMALLDAWFRAELVYQS